VTRQSIGNNLLGAISSGKGREGDREKVRHVERWA